MDRNLIFNQLKKIGFTEIEANIYLYLIEHSGENPTQISKEIDFSRSSVYNSMRNMEEKGIIRLLPAIDDSKNYSVIDPKIYLNIYEKETLETVNSLRMHLDSLYTKYNTDGIYSFDRIDNLTYKIIELIKSTENILVIEGNIYDEIFNDRIKELEEKKILVHINEDKNTDDLVLIKDNSEMILKDSNNMMYTKNSLLINQVSKRIKMEMEKNK
ncbi:TrmB family transcriptional regulator [Streptobacillus notomytis]|uniref:TrmB family transcriptional regulator n=1 Tax=Streptobacillus notomytis TaxID=1712031 RepID=UPI0008341D01|nr:helix-turn-helix domain-containing protein [Streptobacillus notomytis]